MLRRDRYDLSGSSYTQEMDEKSIQYSNLRRRAERLNVDNNGKPTKQEAELYERMIKVCEEIMSLNVSQRSVRAQWEYRKIECENRYKEIVDFLVPPAPKPESAPQRNGQHNSPSRRSSDDKAPTTAPSGFTTAHATKEVPVEMIEKWFKDVPNKGFENVVGRTNLKKRLLTEVASFGWHEVDSALGINPVQCYFLYGPPGTGKTHLIKAFASELKKHGFNFMQLKGSDIHASYVGIAEKIVTTAFAVAEEKEPCLIFMDEIDNLCVSRDGKAEGHEKRLTVAFLEAYNKFKESGKRLIFMGATNHPAVVDEAMLDRISLIKVPLPAEEDRLVYFNKMVMDPETKEPKLALEEGFTPEDMVDVTDNYSYRDLDRLKESMLSNLKVMSIEQYAVKTPNGDIDLQASDKLVSEAIRSGKIKLTRELFDQTRKQNTPSDKTRSRQELKEFEERLFSLNG